jgi:L-fuculose-phosphate aldolase
MGAPISFTHPRDEILETIERIYRNRMTTTSGGNLSIREENGDIWITPTRVDKGSLRREDIVRVRGNGSTEGRHPPSSELPFHQEIYQARRDIYGIVHAHPVALVAFSVVGQVPNTRLFHQAMHVCGEVAFAPYQPPGSRALGRCVAGICGQGYNCVILENHGVVTSGSNLREAFYRFETLEFVGKIIIKARLLGDVRYLSDQEISLSQQQFVRLPEFEREVASSPEKELRRRLCEFVRRAYRQRLFISTQGSYSARLDDSSFLITPYRVDRGMLDAAEVVLVRNGEPEAEKLPSRASRIHEAIYRRRPEIGAIINACPVNATAFSVTSVPLDTRTIPESYVVVRQVGRVTYGLQFEDREELARRFSPSQPTAILENDGVMVTGVDVLEAYDRLEVLESTAEALVNCRAVGTLAPLSHDAIRELERVFLRT